MGSTGLMVLGGLLQGVGKGIENEYEAKRQDALLALKRTYDVEDRDANNAAKMDQTAAEIQGRKDLVQVTGDENRQTEALKTEGDIAIAKIKGTIDLSTQSAIKGLEHKYNLSEIQAKAVADYQKDAKLNQSTPDHYQVAADGKIVIWMKDGTSRGAIGTDGMFVPPSSGSGDDPINLTGDKPETPAKVAPAPAATPGPNDNVKKQALARLGNVYHQAAANPDAFRKQYPGMFDASGKLRSLDELTQQIEDRYGN